jgi:hypothetical protein
MVAHEYRSGKLGHRQRIHLEASEHLEDLLLLSELDQQGRVAGVQVGTAREAIQYLRDLRAENG